MTEYQDAAHEAYRKLKWNEENRPSIEEMERFKKAAAQDDRRRKVSRFRRSIA